MKIEVVQGDAAEIDADVLVLKYAQAPYGADRVVLDRLDAVDHMIRRRLPEPGAFRLCESKGVITPRSVLFVGVVPLQRFDYEAIRTFARSALANLAETKPRAGHVAFTLHGPGYGLDESEAFSAELAGISDAVDEGRCPAGLHTVTFVELNPGRAERLRSVLKDIEPESPALERPSGQPRPGAKPHVFVAMPFAPEFDDYFHYGIQQSVHTAGFLCERADLAVFTGDVIAWVKERIDTSRLLIADLSTSNPNVYLELGYAWGRGIPTVLLARDAADLKFDVKGQRCLVYSSIRKLEELLTRELSHLGKAG